MENIKMLPIIDKVKTLLKRKQAANQWGLKFNRVSNFTLPDYLLVDNQKICLNIPKSQNGMVSEFVEIILDDCYHLKKWSNQLPANCNILDIGGNIGLFSLCARQYFPDAEIHSYEPNPQLEPYLKHQAEVGNFHHYMSGIGSKDGNISLNCSDNKDSMNIASSIDPEGNIPMLAIQKAIEKLGEKVDLVKMDCEGAEWDILQAVEDWVKVDNLELEYHLYKKGHTLEKMQEILQQLGFKIIACQPTNQYYGNIAATRI
ncbi:MAG: FkbM family methyltransferase [Microcystaceae cyanobacterium]